MSTDGYSSLNLGTNANDNPAHVRENRKHLARTLLLPSEPVWLNQKHTNRAVTAEHYDGKTPADASVTSQAGIVCAAMTADCVPIVLYDPKTNTIAAIHAGWRGLLNNVIAATLTCMPTPHQKTLAWIGPAIGPAVFEVGFDVLSVFSREHPSVAQAFTLCPGKSQKWLMDGYAIAKYQLQRAGIPMANIYGAELCTYSDPARFFSYRRDGAATGRMVTLIWRTS